MLAKRKLGKVFGVGLLLVLLLSMFFPGQVSAETNRYFPVTGHNVSGDFLKFFDTYGGLDMFGYPRTEAIREGGRLVQYFQRARMELWPENPAPYNVQLMLIGDVVYGAGDPPISIDLIPPATDVNNKYFPETGHVIGYPFLDYFNSHGGLTFFGYPTTEQYFEGGVKVQRFQRARLEWHPDNPDPYKVQLGLLGDQYIFQQRKVDLTLTLWVPDAAPNQYATSANSSNAQAGAISAASYDGTVSGGRLVFQTSSGGDIYIINPDGTGLQKVASDGVDPTWSPDGQKIAFSRWDGEKGIYTMSVGSNDPPTKVFDVNDAQSTDWSPDGTRIAFDYPRDGFTYKLNRMTGRIGPTDDEAWVVGSVNLSSGTGFDFGNGIPHAYSPSWTPDGKSVVFKGDKGLYISGLDGSVNLIPHTDTRYTMPVVSPDGTQILFQYLQNTYWQVGVMNIDGSGMHLLTSINPLGPSANNMSATWSPGGKSVAFATDREGAWRLYIMNADGSNQHKLTDVSIDHQQPYERTVSWSK